VNTKEKGFDGIALYNIEMDGCLNGVYTDIEANGVIFNEINRKKKYSEAKSSDIIGDYDSLSFDRISKKSKRNKYCRGSLKITKYNKAYSFKWINSHDVPEYEGIGYKMNTTQIAVTYWTV
jgi:hypothetical protein